MFHTISVSNYSLCDERTISCRTRSNMTFQYILLISLILLISFSSNSARTLSTSRLSKHVEENRSSSTEDQDYLKFVEENAKLFDRNKLNEASFDSYEEKKFHERSLIGSSSYHHASQTNTRQALLELLQKAIDEGWKPPIKHYVPATRFGRHRR